MRKTPQIDAWVGDFGINYINRNDFSEEKLSYGIKAWKKMLGNIEPSSVLEVGSNIGLNLWFLNNILGDQAQYFAVEPNKIAYERLKEQTLFSIANCWNENAFNLPLQSSSVDFVFTSGVLIHIHPNELSQAMSEVVRVSRRYVLCAEYFSHEPEEIRYHGKSGLLWKRDFGRKYLELFPELQVVNYGFLWEEEYKYFDDITWWLFEKI